MRATVPFAITDMDASLPEGIDFQWKGCKLNTGPIRVTLDEAATLEGDNRGELDYGSNRARARFNMKLEIPALARRILGVAIPGMEEPIRGTLHSEGEITEDHNFGLSGPLEVRDHPLVDSDEVAAAILPGR